MRIIKDNNKEIDEAKKYINNLFPHLSCIETLGEKIAHLCGIAINAQRNTHELIDKNKNLQYKLDRLQTDIDGENTELANRGFRKIKKILIEEIELLGDSYWVERSEIEWKQLKKELEDAKNELSRLRKDKVE